MTQIICNRNRGYQWTESNHCYFKGYLQTPEGEVIRGERAIALLCSIASYEDFCRQLGLYFGSFATIICKDKEIWLATDIARSIPLYYTDELDYITDDAECIVSMAQSGRFTIDPIRALEMYTSSFVAFQRTIYKGIDQVELGCAARICDGKIIQNPYYIHGSSKPKTTEDIMGRLSLATDRMIHRTVAAAAGRTIVLSLSGGYDSRYLACSLKKNGIDQVICYTYGRSDSFEVKQSKKVADALNYRWVNIHYDDSSIREILNSDVEYLKYSNRPDYITYLQNYLAVKKLHEDNLIPEDAVFITGLCNDMPTGYYIPREEEANQYGYTIEGVAAYNIADRFVKFSLSSEAKGIFLNDIKEYYHRMGIEVNDYQSFVSALDCLETANFHSHCFLNMNTVHEFFGYEWLLPCWDRELLDFWYSLPAEKRIGQKSYEQYLLSDLAFRYGLGTKKHINLSASTPLKQKLKRQIGAMLVKIAYPLGIPLRRNTDINNFSVLEVELYKRIRQKKAIKADRAALILLLTIFMMEFRYGTNWFKDINCYLE